MVNQLSVPFKKAYALDVKEAARNYIHEYSGTHPDAFKWDINHWHTLRKDGVGGVAHVDRIDATLRYHAQLVFILAKIPTDIGLEIAYAPVFSPNSIPISLRSLAYERAAVVFNLAALYSQLAASEDRSSQEGLKRARAYYQRSAGAFSFLVSSVLPKLVPSSEDEEIPLDLSEPFVHSLQWLMRAQAQECAWQLAVLLSSYNNGVIAKLAFQASDLYSSSLTTITSASASIRHIFPSEWLSHIETKQRHFEAAAQYRKSVDDLGANRYGHEIARLRIAHDVVKRGYDLARRGGVAPAVLHDIKSLLDNVQKNITRAERDNDLIYHQDVPAASSLPQISLQGAMMADDIVDPPLRDPGAALRKDEDPIFEELMGWGSREAINIYNDNKQTLIKDKVIDTAQELDLEADRTLRSLNLPAALEAMERPVGLPPSLLKKAEEVRLEDGPAKIEASIESIQMLVKHITSILDEAMDILDSEASEDESARKDKPINRLPSYQANQELVEKDRRYRETLAKATESDEIVRQKWDKWERNIVELTWDEADLEASIPSSTVSSSTSTGFQTQSHARRLRVLLESLDDLIKQRRELVTRAQRLADVDDITPAILKKANGFERLVEVQPVMFEDISDEGLAKYDKFMQELEISSQKQEEILAAIKARNEQFLQSRRDDPVVKEREHALQSLDLAYHMYREIIKNLDEGLQFYNSFAALLHQFKETCKTWSNTRQQEILTLKVNKVHIDNSELMDHVEKPQSPGPRSPTTRKASGKQSFGLPPPNSAEWESLDMPPPPRRR